MARKIKLSTQATEHLDRARISLEMRNRDKYEPLRIALARSLQKESPLEQISSTDKKGFEIEVPTLEQNDGLLFRLLLQQLYQRRLTDDEYDDYLKWHLEDGLKTINAETDSINGYEYLLLLAEKGGRDGGLPNQYKDDTDGLEPRVIGFDGTIKLHVGTVQSSKTAYHINFNNVAEHNNNHVAIIGKPGSGKTTFIKHFITELRKKSNFQTQFIMFDYKGDLWNAYNFHRDTRAEVLNVSRQPIPLNMFKLEENTEQERKGQAERFVQTVRDVEANIGKAQEQKLYDAVLAAYNRVEGEGFEYPDFTDIRAELERTEKKADSLTSVFRPLTEHNLFAEKEMPLWDSLLNRSVIFDIHALPAKKELCVFFILKELQRKIMALPDSPVHPGTSARTMRTVIVIDEAHHFLNDKKRVKILAEMIREVRSKGVAVVLLSQSPSDFDQAEFDFLEMLEFVFVLQSNASAHNFLQQVFGVSADEARKLKSNIADLPAHTAFTKVAKVVEKISLGKP
ncbi:MAG: ATP-binding protein [Candidatus Kapabacteria bacterium]|jgi:DNA sulfur modification protein DndE|nr:ATP-binding protein [Candidatus Kapabacteria bacterium]